MARMRMLAGLMVIAAVLGGCNKSNPSAPAANQNAAQGTNTANSPQNGALQSDGTYAANPAGSAGTPAQAAAGGAAAGTPPANTSAPVVVSAPAGTAVVVRTTEEVTSSMGDGTGFTGVLERPVLSHGTVIFAKGTPVAGVIVAAKNKGTFKGAGDLGLQLTTIGNVRVHTSEFVETAKGRGKRTGAFIGGGGGVGALIGGLAGGGKGALIGGLAGAGAGTAASTTGNKAVVLRPESVITFRLREPVSN